MNNKFSDVIKIVANVSLTVMSVIISVTTCSIERRQKLNDEILNSPVINLQTQSFAVDENGDSEAVQILNINGIGYNFKIHKHVFLECMFFDFLNPKRSVFLPISDILDSSFQTGNYKGLICTYYTIGNLAYLNKLNREAMKYTKCYVNLELHKYFIIEYKDFKDVVHHDLYKVSSLSGGEKIQMTNDIRDLFELEKNGYSKISELTIENILKALDVE